MRALIWFVILFALAVALALVTGDKQAVVTLYLPPDTAIYISLTAGIMLLTGVFLLLQLLAYAYTLLRTLPQQAKAWRQQQHERAIHRNMLDALSNFISGRFVRARKSARNALQRESKLSTENALPYRMQLRALAHFMVAQSSHSLQDAEVRNQALENAIHAAAQAKGDAATETSDGLRMRHAAWLLHEHAPQHALEVLERLPQGAGRRVQALRLKLKSARQLGKTELALETARTLVRHKAFSEYAGQVLMARLAQDLVSTAHEPEQLRRIWKKLDSNERAQIDVALAAAAHLLRIGGDAAQARSWLLPVWQQYAANPSSITPKQRSQLLATLLNGTEFIDATWLKRIEETHLRYPNRPALQYLMGMTCLQRRLWGKAQALLQRCVHQLHDEPALQRNAWRALATLAEHKEDHAAATHAWRQAAHIDVGV